MVLMFLSIIIPTYNVENYIHVTLNSLINQSDKDFEIIVVDDGSTDNTYNKVKDLLQTSDIYYRIIKKENGGVSSARNRGLFEASGDYVLFLDGDDYVSSDLVITIKNKLEDRTPDIFCWGFNTVSEDKTILIDYFNKYIHYSCSMTGVEALKKIIINKIMWIYTGSAAYRKDFLIENRLSYTEGCTSGEDQEFTYKALSKASSVIFIDKVLSYYLQRKGSITNRYNIKRFDAINAMKRTYEYIFDSSNNELKEVAEYFKMENILANYFYNLHSCFYHSSIKNINILFSEIDKKYPGLNREMIELMKNYRGQDRKLFAKIKLFLISPQMYFSLLNLKHKIKDARKG